MEVRSLLEIVSVSRVSVNTEQLIVLKFGKALVSNAVKLRACRQIAARELGPQTRFIAFGNPYRFGATDEWITGSASLGHRPCAVWHHRGAQAGALPPAMANPSYQNPSVAPKR